MASVSTYVDDLVGAMRLNRDAESICRANQGLAAVQGAVKERNLKYQELIAEMTGKRDVARNALMEKGNMAENDAYLRKVNIRDDLSVNLSGNANKQKENEKVLAELDGELKGLRGEVKKAKKARDAAESTSSTLTLFKDISNITWDYTSDSIKGHVAKSDRHDVRRFDFDASMTRFDTTQKLWEMIGTQ